MSQITFLYQLQKIDSEIDRITKRIEEINLIINSDQDILMSQSSLEKAEQKHVVQLKLLEKIESEVWKHKTKVKQSEDRLYSGNVKNPKELQDLQTEIKSINGRISDLEDEQIEIMLVLEDLEQDLNQKKSAHHELIKEKTRNNSALLAEKKVLESDLQTQLTQRAPALSQISEELLAKYDKLRKTRSGIAVSILDDNMCSACGTSLTSSDIQKIRSHNADYFCSSCKRFLFSG